VAGIGRPETHTTVKRLHNCWGYGNLRVNERTLVPANPVAAPTIEPRAAHVWQNDARVRPTDVDSALHLSWVLACGEREVGAMAVVTGCIIPAVSDHLGKLELAGAEVMPIVGLVIARAGGPPAPRHPRPAARISIPQPIPVS
jgi:hypothetical protein